MIDVNLQIGKNIANARKSTGMKQEELAQTIGLTRTSITNIENGKQRVPIENLYKFAEILKVDIYTLIPSSNSKYSDVKLPGEEKLHGQFDEDIIIWAKRIYFEALQKKGVADFHLA